MSETDGKKRGWFGRLIGKKDETPGSGDAPLEEKEGVEPPPEAADAAIPAPESDPAENSPSEENDAPEAALAAESGEDRPEAENDPAETQSAPENEPETKEPETAAQPETTAGDAPGLVAFGDIEKDEAVSDHEGWFSRIRKGLSRSSGKLSGGISDLLSKRKLDQDALEELEDLLITSDLGVFMARRMARKLTGARFESGVESDEVKEALAEAVAEALEPVAKPLLVDLAKKPHVILMVGVNGSGKTTTIGKLAKYYRDRGLKTTLVAGDTFRAAAVEQLKVWGARADCPVVSGQPGADAAGLAFDALVQAKKRGDDLVLIDTAGRLQNKSDLMAELNKIVRVLKKQDETVPHDVLLVLDATVGQNAHSQVEHFRDITNVTGLIVTKLDGTARGGVVVALAEKFGLPIHAIGVGESVDDLRPFRPDDFARSLVGLE